MTTHFENSTLTFDWTLEGFNALTYSEVSPKFSGPSPRDQFKFHLMLYPNGNQETGFATLMLAVNGPPGESLRVDFRLGVVDNNGLLQEKHHFSKNDHIFAEKSNYCLTKGLMKREHLINFVSNGKLNIRCELFYLKFIKRKLTAIIRGDGLEVLEDMKSLLLDATHADVVLKVEGKEIKAHRLILALRSPVFRAMFEPNTMESKEGVVDVQEMSHEVLQTIVGFLYTGKVESRLCSLDLLKGADFYHMKGLRAICEQELGHTLTIDNALDSLIVADQCSLFHLRDVCLDFITKNGKQIKETDKWKEEIETHPNLLLMLYNKVSK